MVAVDAAGSKQRDRTCILRYFYAYLHKNNAQNLKYEWPTCYTMDDLDRIFGKNGNSEDDFDNSPDEYDLMEDELKDFIMEQRNKIPTKKTDLCI